VGRHKKEPIQPPAQKIDGRRFVLYRRISTDEQKKGYGMDAQKDICEGYATIKGLEIIAYKDDEGLSGTLPVEQRPGLLEAVNMCLEGKADGILTYAQDRYAREPEVWANLRKRAFKHFSLWTVKENTDFSTEESMFMGDIYGAVSALERRTIRDRLINGRKQRAIKDGKASGPLPYGYRYRVEVGADGDITKHIEIDPAAATVVRLILDMQTAGATYAAIAERLNGSGYVTPQTGAAWTPGHLSGVMRHRRVYVEGVKDWGQLEGRRKWPILWPEQQETKETPQ
jgi:site-specific DNA recombinase